MAREHITGFDCEYASGKGHSKRAWPCQSSRYNALRTSQHRMAISTYRKGKQAHIQHGANRVVPELVAETARAQTGHITPGAITKRMQCFKYCQINTKDTLDKGFQIHSLEKAIHLLVAIHTLLITCGQMSVRQWCNKLVSIMGIHNLQCQRERTVMMHAALQRLSCKQKRATQEDIRHPQLRM